MKPQIYKRNGLWHYAVGKRVATGQTIEGAYINWLWNEGVRHILD